MQRIGRLVTTHPVSLRSSSQEISNATIHDETSAVLLEWISSSCNAWLRL